MHHQHYNQQNWVTGPSFELWSLRLDAHRIHVVMTWPRELACHDASMFHGSADWVWWQGHGCLMMASSNGNICRVTGHWCGEFTGPRWTPRAKGQWRGALMFPLICFWINDLLNNRDAGDLRRYRANYDVIVTWSWKHAWVAQLCWHKILILALWDCY